jgi:hypothetical protein
MSSSYERQLRAKSSLLSRNYHREAAAVTSQSGGLGKRSLQEAGGGRYSRPSQEAGGRYRRPSQEAGGGRDGGRHMNNALRQDTSALAATENGQSEITGLDQRACLQRMTT